MTDRDINLAMMEFLLKINGILHLRDVPLCNLKF